MKPEIALPRCRNTKRKTNDAPLEWWKSQCQSSCTVRTAHDESCDEDVGGKCSCVCQWPEKLELKNVCRSLGRSFYGIPSGFGKFGPNKSRTESSCFPGQVGLPLQAHNHHHALQTLLSRPAPTGSPVHPRPCSRSRRCRPVQPPKALPLWTWGSGWEKPA